MELHSHRILSAVSVLALGLSFALQAAPASAQSEKSAAAPSAGVVAGKVDEGAFKGETFTFSSFGGVLQNAQTKTILTPFGQITGAQTFEDGPTLIARISAMAEAGRMDWDVVTISPAASSSHCGSLFMKLDLTLIDTSKLPAGTGGECYVPANQLAELLVYDTAVYPDGPKSWADFFDIEKFPGKRGMQNMPGVSFGPLIAAALADGVAPEDLYPFDYDRAFKKLDTIKDHLVFWTSGAELQQMMDAGELAMTYAFSGRMIDVERNGRKIAGVWNQALLVGGGLSIPVGVKNPKMSHAFINYYLGKDQQKAFAEMGAYGSVNVDAELDPEPVVAKWLPIGQEKLSAGVVPDFGYWAENYETTESKWLEWINK